MSKKWCGLGIILLLCMVINLGRVLLHGYLFADHLGGINVLRFPSMTNIVTMHYSYTLTHPFNDWSNNQSYFDYLIKTAIFGEYQWSSPNLAVMLDILLIMIVAYTILPWFFAQQSKWRGIVPIFLGLAIPAFYHFCFFLRDQIITSVDIRYIFPSLICFIIFFGKSYEIYKARGALVMTVLGPFLACSFSALSIFFFWNNFR